MTPHNLDGTFLRTSHSRILVLNKVTYTSLLLKTNLLDLLFQFEVDVLNQVLLELPFIIHDSVLLVDGAFGRLGRHGRVVCHGSRARLLQL